VIGFRWDVPTLSLFPKIVWDGVFSGRTFLKYKDCSSVRCAFEALHTTKVIYLEHAQVFAVTKLKSSKPFATTFRFEDGLRYNEPKFSFGFEILVR